MVAQGEIEPISMSPPLGEAGGQETHRRSPEVDDDRWLVQGLDELPGLVKINIANWKDPRCLLG